ncbi:hypothetical protein WJ542_21995 [Paraburkholderia sp. B3]|uniref:hypothetical protein n=1 Tax=Paraburkholderia sp. B3 TaxID=3134791 RepID=UPI0039829A4D
MTRVESNNQAAEILRQAEEQQAHRVQERLRHATLHHGTSFAYGSNSPHARMMRSMNLRRLQQLARLRAMLSKRTDRVRGGAHEGADGEAALPHESADRVTRRRDGQGGRHGNSGNGSGGGRSGGNPKRLNVKVLAPADRYRAGRRQDGHPGGGSGHGGGHGGDAGGPGGSGQGSGRDSGNGGSGHDGRPAQPLDAAARDRGGKVAPIAGKLGAAAAHAEAGGGQASHPDLFAAAWANDVLDLLDELRDRPEMAFDDRAIDLNIAWLQLQKRFGSQVSGGIAMFAEQAAARRAACPAATMPEPAPHAAARSPRQVVTAAGSDAGAARDWHERLRDARFLAPLISLNGNHPRPPAWLDAALARLDGMRAFNLDRAGREPASAAPHQAAADAATPARNGPGEPA